MNGKIFFNELSDLSEFLKTLVGTTVTFEVRQQMNGQWVLEFTGGY